MTFAGQCSAKAACMQRFAGCLLEEGELRIAGHTVHSLVVVEVGTARHFVVMDTVRSVGMDNIRLGLEEDIVLAGLSCHQDKPGTVLDQGRLQTFAQLAIEEDGQSAAVLAEGRSHLEVDWLQSSKQTEGDLK